MTAASAFDPVAFKRTTREQWQHSAEAWDRWTPILEAWLRPVTEAMIELARIREGDTVLDPFCGCGTSVAAAQKLGRRWIGIDVTHLAITLIRSRLADTYGDRVAYEVVGEPADVGGAGALAKQDRYQFQWWALGKIRARPVADERKKGADSGIDGKLFFRGRSFVFYVGDGTFPDAAAAGRLWFVFFFLSFGLRLHTLKGGNRFQVLAFLRKVFCSAGNAALFAA